MSDRDRMKARRFRRLQAPRRVFNRAYNPYCYYNESYECPYPPPENRLKVPIRVGEKLKK